MSNEQRIQFVRSVKDRLDTISPTMCLAKWTQSTIYLWNGQTHSCHHPGTHKIPVEGLKENPAQLHNTPHKQELRQQMLAGVKVAECEYCWNIENLGKDYLSDRHMKSATEWSLPYFDQIVESKQGKNFTPRYIEIAFETTCNFKCTYCFPHISSRVNEEIVAHGPYRLPHGVLNDIEHLKLAEMYPIDRKEHNPYIEAFWKWWPELYQSVDHFRITGGEPLLSKHTWTVIDYLIEHPRPGFHFAINTNFGIEGALVDKLIDKLNQIIALGMHVEVYTSLESTGKQAEYARFGMDFELFQRNVDKFLTDCDRRSRLVFMTTVNILSATTFISFLGYVFDLRRKFNFLPGPSRVGLSINYLRYPDFLALPNLPHQMKVENAALWSGFVRVNLKETSPHPIAHFYLEELNNIERMCEWMVSTPFWRGGTLEHQRDSFAMYHRQYDHRRTTNFLETFPELEQMLTHDK
jgi:organic radical activating enzyme